MILGIETSGSRASFGVMRGDEILSSLTRVPAASLSKHIMQWIDQVMREANVQITGLDAIAVSRGPGSWTGLRTGVTTANTLAQTVGIPVVGVPTFDALARVVSRLHTSGTLATLAPSRRDEVFAAYYQLENELQPRPTKSVHVTPVGEFLATTRSMQGPVYVCGEGALVYQSHLQPHFPESFENGAICCHAEAICVLALEALRSGRPPCEPVWPFYVLPSQAERNAGVIVVE